MIPGTENEWKCVGCGAVAPDKRRPCNCPTGLVGRGGRGYAEVADAWGTDPVADELTSLRARVLVLEGALAFYRDEWTTPPIGPREQPQPTIRLSNDQGERAHSALQGLSQDQGREGYGASGGRVQAAPDGATEGQHSDGGRG